MEMAAEDVNAYLASIGATPRLRIVVEDTKVDPSTAQEKLAELSAQDARVVVGPQSSAEAAAVKDYADANSILLVSQSSTAGSLSIAGDNLFRFTPDDALEGEAAAALMWADGVRVVIPIWRGDDGNDGLRAATKRAFEARGGAVLGGRRYSPSDAADLAPALADLRPWITQPTPNAGPRAVYLAGFDEVTQLFALAQADPAFSSIKWYGSDGVAMSDALIGNPLAARFAVKVGYPNPLPGLDERAKERWSPVSQRIAERTGRAPEAFALGAYDAVWVAALAELASAEAGTFEALKAAFELTAKSYYGATGWTLLNAAGDRKAGNFDFWSVKEEGGAFKWVRTASVEVSSGYAGQVQR